MPKHPFPNEKAKRSLAVISHDTQKNRATHCLNRTPPETAGRLRHGISRIPKSTRIGEDAFYNAGLTSVVIPKSVKYLGSHAFRCNTLSEVTISKDAFDSFDYDDCNDNLNFDMDVTVEIY